MAVIRATGAEAGEQRHVLLEKIETAEALRGFAVADRQRAHQGNRRDAERQQALEPFGGDQRAQASGTAPPRPQEGERRRGSDGASRIVTWR